MKSKSFFIVSIVCLIISIIFSFFIICSSFVVLKDAKSLLYSAEVEIQNIYDIKESSFSEADVDKTEEKSVVENLEENQVVLESKKESLGEFKLTAYCSCEKCCGKWALNRPKDENGKDIVYGSTGAILVAGTSIAVDPSVIPYGSQVEINGHTYTAHDTGGAIKGNRIDVYFDNHQDALNFGVQYAEVFLIGGEQ